MPPQIALLGCVIFVCVALILDSRGRSHVSNAIWIPLIWVVILASRSVGQWFDPGSAMLGMNVEEGSPIDRGILSLLILAALAILVRRDLHWTRWIKENAWVFAFFLYCGVSIVWSDFPAVAFKRWVRALGAVMMILVILSERDPVAAIATVVRRCAFILLPFSVVLIKYYRDLGVGYDAWTGEQLVFGVTTDKNALGRLCLISGLFAFWELVTSRHNTHIRTDTTSKLVGASVFLVSLWLLRISDSATALATFLMGCSILWVLGLKLVRRRTRYLGTLILLFASVMVILSLSFNLVETIIASLGRDTTLTYRTFIWRDLLALDINPVVGVGYDSFWLGERLDRFVRTYQVASAHNGYLELYLELGIVGLMLFAGLLANVFVMIKRTFTMDLAYGRLRMAVLAVFLVYNVTEAGYKATTFIFFVLLLVAIEVPSMRKSRNSRAGRADGRRRNQALRTSSHASVA